MTPRVSGKTSIPGGSGGGLGELSRGIFTVLLLDNCRKRAGHGGDRKEEEGGGEVGRESMNKSKVDKKRF
jgi:hypothetical protein